MKQNFEQAQQPQRYTSEQEKIRAQQASMQEDARAMAPGIFHEDGSFTPADTAEVIQIAEFVRAA